MTSDLSTVTRLGNVPFLLLTRLPSGPRYPLVVTRAVSNPEHSSVFLLFGMFLKNAVDGLILETASAELTLTFLTMTLGCQGN